MLADHSSTLLWTEDRGVDFQVIDTWHVHGLLPQAHGLWYRVTFGVIGVPGSAPPLHDNFEWAAHTCKQDRETFQLLGAIGENPERNRIGIMVPNIHYDT